MIFMSLARGRVPLPCQMHSCSELGSWAWVATCGPGAARRRRPYRQHRPEPAAGDRWTGKYRIPATKLGRSDVQAHMKRVCCVIGAAAIGISILSSCSSPSSPRQTVTGMLVRVGGLATLEAAEPVPLPGEVVARNAAGQEFTAATSKNGRFELSLPLGTYRLTGHTLPVSGRTCRATRSVRVTTRKPLHNIWVVCLIR
jgi:hypothetical protein